MVQAETAASPGIPAKNSQRGVESTAARVARPAALGHRPGMNTPDPAAAIRDALTILLDAEEEIDRDKPYLQWLAEDCGYLLPRETGTGWWVAVERLIYHGSLIAGRMGDYIGHDYRYCYPTVADAATAMLLWEQEGWVGEPQGWHKRKSLPARLT